MVQVNLETGARQASKPCSEETVRERVQAFHQGDPTAVRYDIVSSSEIDADVEASDRVARITYNTDSDLIDEIDRHILNYFQPIMEDMFASRPNPLRVPVK